MSAEVAQLLQHGRRLLADYALLAVLDVRSAALQLAIALAAVLVVSMLGTTAWLACVVAVVAWLTGNTGWPGALIGAAALNIVAAVLLLLWLKGRLTSMPFAATLRQLRGEAPGKTRHD